MDDKEAPDLEDYQDADHAHSCEQCGELATHKRSGYDVTPTDRGDERRYAEEWVCDECDPETSRP
jgi:hypothetical protein